MNRAFPELHGKMSLGGLPGRTRNVFPFLFVITQPFRFHFDLPGNYTDLLLRGFHSWYIDWIYSDFKLWVRVWRETHHPFHYSFSNMSPGSFGRYGAIFFIHLEQMLPLTDFEKLNTYTRETQVSYQCLQLMKYIISESEGSRKEEVRAIMNF